MKRKSVEVLVPDGYENVQQFLNDCGLERYNDTWTITIRKWRERLFFAWCLIFNWPR